MNKSDRHRIALVVLAVVCVVTAIGTRLFALQVSKHDELREQADAQHFQRIEVPPMRGSIVDRRGRELAVSLVTESLYAHPWKVADPTRVAETLAGVLDRPRKDLFDLLRSERSFVFLDRFLDPDRAEAVRELEVARDGSQSIGFLDSSKRYYPHDELAAHIVGFASIDGKGLAGIELRFDKELRGEPTVYQAVRDARSGSLRQMLAPAGRPARDVVLTIDLVLQHFVERELEHGMKETGARAGSAVLIDPRTGDVLALANRPAPVLSRYGAAGDRARANRAVVHQYEPGSTFKIVPMAAALERGVRPEQRFDCENGCLALGKRRIRDSKPHATLSVREILHKSSNIGMVKIGRELAPADLHETILRFGFGRKTGVELPGELPGAFRPAARWDEHSKASIAFGHEIAVTVVQMASAVATIANDGVRVPPRIVLGLRDRAGVVEPMARPEAESVISARVARELAFMMEGVVTEGTGTRAAVPGYRIAGKTGTAQKIEGGAYSHEKYMASFGGFGPVSSPRVALLVVLDSPSGPRHQGGQVTAPLFAKIMAEALAHLRVPPDHEPHPVVRVAAAAPAPAPHVHDSPQPADAAPGVVPDVSGMSLREAIVSLSATGCRAEYSGSGRVFDQSPVAGSSVAPGDPCRVRLREPGGRAG